MANRKTAAAALRERHVPGLWTLTMVLGRRADRAILILLLEAQATRVMPRRLEDQYQEAGPWLDKI